MENESVIPKDVREDLLKSGIPIEEALKVGWSAIFHPTGEQMRELLNFSPKDVRRITSILVIPYFDRDENLIYKRIKMYPPPEGGKYLSPKGEKLHLLIWPDDWKKLASPKTKIVVVEGEKKWLKTRLELPESSDCHHVVIGISGITCWNGPEWKEIDLIGRDVLLIFDTDSEDNKNVRREEIKMYAWFRNEGANPKSLLWNKERGKGIDDYLAHSANPGEELQRLLRESINPLVKYAKRSYIEITRAIGKVELNAKTKKVLAQEIKECVKDAEKLRFTSVEKDIQPREGKSDFRKSQADTLLELLKALIEQGDIAYFKDQLEEVWARTKVSSHFENHRINSRYFRLFAQRAFHQACGKAINKESLGTAISNLEAALPDLEQHELHIRVARKDGAIYYDLSNAKWEVVRINCEGWEVIADSPVYFKRFPHQKPQVMPEKGGSVKQLLKLLNLKGSFNQILALVWLIASFIPCIPHPMPVLFGSQGSGKSFFLKLIREIIDPSVILLLCLAKDKTELVQQISHHYFCAYDNLTRLTEWVADAFCRAVTGEGATKRRLYTDDDDVVYRYRRVIAVNGINCVSLRPDLLDRSILVELSRISPEKRMEESELWKSFNEAKPKILGNIFDVLSQTLCIFPSVSLKILPRMADFGRWGYAIAEALGIGGETFLQAYFDNIQTQNIQVIEGNPIAACLSKFIQDRGKWIGTASELLSEVEEVAETLKINTKVKGWVTTPNVLTRKLNILKVNLEEVGITYINNHKQAGSNIYLSCRKGTDSTVSTVSSVRPAVMDSNSPDDSLTITDDKNSLASVSKPASNESPDANDGKFSTESGKLNGMERKGEYLEI